MDQLDAAASPIVPLTDGVRVEGFNTALTVVRSGLHGAVTVRMDWRYGDRDWFRYATLPREAVAAVVGVLDEQHASVCSFCLSPQADLPWVARASASLACICMGCAIDLADAARAEQADEPGEPG